ncbi:MULTISPECIES: hydroxyacylglutathione hydrolase [Xenorhabdus]|uniref:Hydroxyacylglutathione hydrolase n=1 Tax=Xenorhabdus ehlersii TaxID=290111 RepID=A0A2D0IKX0_9GAMM|nr:MULTISPECIES: hydroxyacylglutathione hydrolase [Xenorhabdus]MBC8948685.1 metallo-beta-lactamase superfamily protein [Xenorhabdus sp. TS4]PHM22420.1 metallo-beta-lactamase superfamily protein [Xenorhabdus ehlersii]RKE92969.1 hydroxyacylglutathione hydrolase [Xenorhabdus ehlersii]
MDLIRIPALSDNYIWLLCDENKHCAIIDPAESQPVIDILAANQLTPAAILLTHHHYDHVGGVPGLLKQYPELPVYGPEETQNKGITHIVHENNTVEIGSFSFRIIALPGHTLGHIAFYQAPYLFCGDTLFSGGCGRLFEGTAEQMFSSLEKISSLPDDTLICCAHEYTAANMKFAKAVLPDNQIIHDYYQEILKLRENNQATIPTDLQTEKKINVFLNCHDIDLQKNIGIKPNSMPLSSIFQQLRIYKDRF